ncbi:MAG: hypothetical protein PVI59_14865 [Anaerolineae bacterium]|jgi:hypothetical protein
MGWLIGVVTILTMVLLRIALPIAAIFLLAYVVRRFSEHWEAAGA